MGKSRGINLENQLVMKRITFRAKPAQHIYDDYMNRVEKCTSMLSPEDRTEMIMEINSHIYEAISRSGSDNEANDLVDVITRLGVPEEFLKPLVANKQLTQAVRTFNPKDLFLAIMLNLKNGVIYPVFGLLYLFLFSFVVIIIMKIISPEHTGLFYNGDSFRGFGYLNNTAGLTEILGYWMIPVTGLTATALYFAVTLLLRIIRRQ